MKQHEEGVGAKFTRVHGVDTLIYLEAQYSKKDALKRENEVTLEVLLNIGDVNKVAGGDYSTAFKTCSAKASSGYAPSKLVVSLITIFGTAITPYF